MRLITKSGSTSSPREMATIESPSTTPRTRSRRASTAIPRWSSSSSAASSSAPGSSPRTCRSLPEPGTYMTGSAGSQPVLLLRDDEGVLRAFRNVCRHRGSRLLSGSGECGKAIRCRYHGWTYRLNGELIGVPEARTIPDLDKSTLGLFPLRRGDARRARVREPRPARVAARRAGGGASRAPGPVRHRGADPRPSVQRLQPANWKIVADNYLEGYHVPIAHPGLMRMVDYKSYEVDLHDGYAWFRLAAARQALRQRDGARLPAARGADARAAR